MMIAGESSLPSHVELLFNGSKPYVHEGVSFDVLIVAHLIEATIEILVYSSDVGAESPHLYVSKNILDA